MKRSPKARWRNGPVAAFALMIVSLVVVQSLKAIEPAEDFLEGLREKKLFDVAIDYLDSVKDSDAVSVDFKRAYLFERGKTLVAGAKYQRDPALREKQLDEAQKTLDEFISNPATPELTIAARNQLGNVIVERARARVEKSAKSDQKQKLLTEARALYPEAIKVFSEQVEAVKQRLLQYPKAGLDPKKDAKKIEQRDALRLEYLQATLLLAAAREEMADAYPKDAPERKKALEEAAKEYGEMHKDFRTLIGGMYAELYQARCLQKLGKHKDALGHFRDLLEQPDAPEAFRRLKVATTSIAMDSWIAEKNYAEAVAKGLAIVDSARPTEANTDEFMSLRVSTARACKLYSDELKAKEPNNAEVKRSLNNGRKLLQYVQRFPGEYQNDARKMLADFAGAESETAVGKVEPKTFEEAKTNGQEAIQEMQAANTIARALGPRVAAEKDPKAKAEAAKQLADSQKSAADNKDKALYYFDYALRLADEKSSLDDLNLIRYLLCYLKYSDGHYFEAVVLGEFIARRYPASSGARPCAKIALASYLKLYTENKTDNKEFESGKIVDVADYIVQTWPDQPEAEEALNTLIPFMIKERQLDRAREYLAKIPLDSKFRGAAELKTGQALWSQYLEGMREVREWETGEGNPPEATEIAARKKDLETLKTEARDTLANGVKRMQGGGEIGIVEASAVLSLAQIYVDTNEAAKAVALLEDAKIGTLTLVQKKDPAVERDPIPDETFKTALRAYISSLATKGATPEQTTATIGKAKGIMAELKTRMGSTKEGQAKLVSIYVSLARDLQRQMDYAPPEAKSALGAGFKVFLDQVGSDANELNVLTWVAETYRGMGESFIADGKVSEEGRKYLEEASKVYSRILDLGKSDKSFLTETQTLQIRLSLAKTLRSMGKYVEAMNSFEEILKQNSQMLPMQIEAAKTYQQWAALFKGDETKQWQYYASAIIGARPDKSNPDKRKQGKNVIWGWGEIARMTANDKRFTDAFHEARYNLALCRYRMALATKDATKKEKAMKQARSDIAITRGLFPDLGGEKWVKQYDKLFKDIQKQLGEKPVGLIALDDTNKTASAAP